MPRVKARHTARGIVLQGNSVLLLERWRDDAKTGKHLHYFSVPGGGIEPGETPQAAVVRELFEETSLLIRPVRLVATQYFEDGSQNSYFLCDYLSGDPKLNASADEVQTPSNRSQPCWVTKAKLAELPLNIVYEPVRRLIVDAFDQKLGSAPVAIK